MVSNEVFVGANAQVGLCPELDLYFDAKGVGGSGLTYSHYQVDNKLTRY